MIVVSKTFTTAETMLNARTVRQWITQSLGQDAVSRHMARAPPPTRARPPREWAVGAHREACMSHGVTPRGTGAQVAVSTNLEAVAKFGIDPNNAFGFWDWVGGRYSVCAAVGVLPLALQYGFPMMRAFLKGARSVDRHFAEAPLEANLPARGPYRRTLWPSRTHTRARARALSNMRVRTRACPPAAGADGAAGRVEHVVPRLRRERDPALLPGALQAGAAHPAGAPPARRAAPHAARAPRVSGGGAAAGEHGEQREGRGDRRARGAV